MLCLVAQSRLTLCNPFATPSLPGSSVHGDSLGRNTGVGCHTLLQGIFPTQGSNPGLLHCRQILCHLSHQGKPKNTGVDSLSLLQWIFLTQESNQGLLHCRQILYQLSYQGSPFKVEEVLFILEVRKIPLLTNRDVSLCFFLCYSIPRQIGNISMITIILMHTFNTVQNVPAAEKALGYQAGSRGPLPRGAYHLSHV